MATAQKTRRPNRGLRSAGARIAFYGGGTVLAVIFLYPMAWTLWSALTGDRASQTGGIGLDNFARVADFGEGIWTYTLNSLTVSLVTVVGTVILTLLGGYAFARFSFPGKNVLFVLCLAILMIPYTSIVIPLYVLLGWIGLQDSLIGLGLVLITLQLPFGMFMMRNSFDALPRELDEAATMDGAGSFRVLTRVLLPGVLPGMVTVAIFSFFASWNEFIAPLIFLTSGSKFTLPVALVTLRTGSLGAVDFEALQAGVILSAIPCLLVFFLLQRYYVRGFTSGALKG